jgi:hypothetical protein
MTQNTEISIKDLEVLMMAAACVRGVYSAIDSHRGDSAVKRTVGDVEKAIKNANRQISNARHIKDPMEDEAATDDELQILKTFQMLWDGPVEVLDPQSLTAVSISRKRLAVMGRLIATIHWGDKTVQTQDKTAEKEIVWKLTAKGAKAVHDAGLNVSYYDELDRDD